MCEHLPETGLLLMHVFHIVLLLHSWPNMFFCLHVQMDKRAVAFVWLLHHHLECPPDLGQVLIPVSLEESSSSICPGDCSAAFFIIPGRPLVRILTELAKHLHLML